MGGSAERATHGPWHPRDQAVAPRLRMEASAWAAAGLRRRTDPAEPRARPHWPAGAWRKVSPRSPPPRAAREQPKGS